VEHLVQDVTASDKPAYLDDDPLAVVHQEELISELRQNPLISLSAVLPSYNNANHGCKGHILNVVTESCIRRVVFRDIGRGLLWTFDDQLSRPVDPRREIIRPLIL
jgi:hypothetical protein